MALTTSNPYVYDDGRTDAEIYLTDILEGKVVASREMRKLAEIMVPRFSEPYKEWHYDVEKATRPVRFIERYCCFPEGEKRGKPFKLEQFQRAIIETAFGFVDDDGYRQFRQVFMVVARKNGKAISTNTDIPTPDGWRKMGDIHIGDKVFGQDGKVSAVVGESEIFYKPTYLMTFEDGSSIKASGDHIWTVQTKGSRRTAKRVPKVRKRTVLGKRYREGGWFETTTQEMFDDPSLVHRRPDGKGVEYKYRVPMCQPAEYPEKDLPIDPYSFGYWLGDGHSNGPVLTVSKDDLSEAVCLLESSGHTCTIHTRKDNPALRITLDIIGCGKTNPFTNSLRDLGVLNNKHIPDIYLQASVEQRWELLRGLMDTDGYVSKAGQCQFVQKKKHIVEQFVELCSSLGIKANMSSKEARCNGKPTGTVYVVEFWTDKAHSCFHLKRKHDRLKEKLAPRMSCKSITSIERIPTEPTKCIAIDNPSHLYLAGRSYTATHNTALLAALMLYMLTSDSPTELGAEVYCCATSEAQARKCFGAADAMREKSPSLNKRLRRGKVQKRGQQGINYDKTGSFLFPLSANVSKLDGLSASAVTYDEIAAATDNGALMDQLEESMAARKQPLIWCISSFNYVSHNIFDERMDYSHGWLDGKVTDDRFLPIIYKLDSREEIYREECWEKANPGLSCGIKGWEYLRDRVNRAKQSPSRMPSLLTKEFNLKSGAYSAYLDVTECINNTPIDFPINTSPYCVVGFDNAERGDLASAVARFRLPGDNNIYEVARFWIPEQSIAINSAKDFKERDQVPYRQWAADGWVDILYETDRINQMVFIDFLRELVDDGIYPFAVAYDPWRVDDWTDREIRRLVGDTRVYPVPQTARVISPLMKEHKLDLHSRRVICPNPCLHHNRSNVQARTDNNDNDFPQKKGLKHHNKIDGFMAELFSLAAYKKFEEEYLSAIRWHD